MSTTPGQRWLAFDTSTDVLSLAAARGERLWTQTLPGGAQASSGLIPAVLALLAEADMPLASLDAIVFGRGPGSFTGLRTACAVAQGLAFGADVPVLPVDTLLAVAEEARWTQVQAGVTAPDAELTVLALLDARMDEVYSAAYRWVQGQWSGHGAWQEAAPLRVGAPESVAMPTGQRVLQAGNAFAAYGERLPPHGLRCEALPTAAALLRLAPALWAQGLAVPAEQAMPLYIRDKVANTTAEREAMKAEALQAKAAAQP
ncbi:tRNA (adenosine(37)-N6)-threonylcarbamoyltransferase complex dimerization subunit type 1 TsaB [Limnohabitans sp. 2KL-1]|jgi:tRNA threonylcarbamoyladenosine biosynthesis protein TsaB|uniref:tRNA (adenosine(37)-N6)-threonylcarbamoyltransferase complex dimerization subunit type 1 TsaB n=1 Tax=Limnohabitans sp. 2KL-1 TaxID=1100699 RepID=UPI000D3CF075|nr:tRNA (adenosine(37)-N6)-threonylcarbamoyltransferase complex dimerization subunit type 1 TsaB [Limnohabitans sp. 2KL-1]PUE46758.1 tRNA (adenosine(37)-N6)-threonylcarbamoyltransferase complex dimerization subunit type 1 TsaB [Limnohabitans sp. 2KL-1]